jgi:hypothetical protein
MIRSTTKKIRDRIIWYTNMQEPYTIEISNHRLALKGENDTFMNSDGMMDAKELHIIKQVRHDIIKYDLAKKIPSAFKKKAIVKKNVLYYNYSDSIQRNTQLGPCVEIDLSAAYWETAYKLGLITDELYKKGEGISKRTRLAAIGSLAKRKLIRAFDGQKEYTIIDKRRETSYLWDVICYHVSLVMQDAAKAAGKDFLFFWTDALFVNEKAAKKVVSCFTKHGYNCKSYKIDDITVNDKYMIVTAKEKPVQIKKDGKEYEIYTRPFPLSKKHKNFSS